MALSPSPLASPRRRVLTDKTTNAVVKNTTSPRPKTTSKLNAAVFRSEHHASKLAGRKRTISEVEGGDGDHRRDSSTHDVEVEDAEDDKRHDDDTTIEKDMYPEMNVDDEEISDDQGSRAAQSSFHASQEPPVEIEETFEIHDDGLRDSQVEQLNATTLPESLSVQPSHTASSITLEQTSLESSFISRTAQGDSQGSLHMSSFVSFSQTEADLKTITPPSAKSLKSRYNVPQDKKERRAFMAQKAQLLRTNLQLASYKIKTGQASTPFRKLKPPSRTDRSSSSPNEPMLPPNPPRMPPPQQLTFTAHHQSIHPSPESRIATLRAYATAQPKPSIKPLHNATAPVLNPTAFSARWQIEQRAQQHAHGSAPQSHSSLERHKDHEVEDAHGVRLVSVVDTFPSSPPSSNGSQHSASHDVLTVRTPSQERKRVRSGTPTPTRTAADANATHCSSRGIGGPSLKEGTHNREEAQLSSPPSSEDTEGSGMTARQEKRRAIDGKTPAGKMRKGSDAGLTSSVVKGEAAGALVELMRSGQTS